jgi:hypothetical protein
VWSAQERVVGDHVVVLVVESVSASVAIGIGVMKTAKKWSKSPSELQEEKQTSDKKNDLSLR